MSQKRITVSTSGIIPKMEELGEAEVRPKLAISFERVERRAAARVDADYAEVSFGGFDGSLQGVSAAELGEADV